MQIGIDTTSAGADVRDVVTAFPLLVRLNATNFDFAEARTDGADIRFLDSGGNNLGYEIDRWDAQNAMAEIWVLVPRIAGNSRNNTVLMYWGNQLSATTSFGPSVFKGYSCVFHMGEDPNNATTQFKDDSGRDNSGTQRPAGRDLRGEGIIGSGLARNPWRSRCGSRPRARRAEESRVSPTRQQAMPGSTIDPSPWTQAGTCRSRSCTTAVCWQR
jgi:biopolymer transport protein ExbB